MARFHKGGSDADCITSRAAGLIVVACFLASAVVYNIHFTPTAPEIFFRLQNTQANSTTIKPRDELEIALKRASTANKTVIISILNEAYAEENGLLDLFLRSFREGEDTEFLINHLLLVAVDKMAFQRCKLLGLHCYRLVTEGLDFSDEVLFMSEGFIKMMWRRTLFLRDVLRRGYSFIFTDMDVLWLRNPFTKLSYDGEDMQMSVDSYNQRPFDQSNPLNTGFYFVASNNKTTALFEEWYENRNNATGMKEQDVLCRMRNEGAFMRLQMKVRFLDTLYFSGFCEPSRDFREVRTVHANCCRIVKAKLTDLAASLEAWKRFNGTSNATWPAHKACQQAWTKDVSKYDLQKSLERTSMKSRTLIITVLNKAYSEENGMLDLFLRSLQQGIDTESLVDHILFVAVDRMAFDRCKLLKLHCYRLITEGVDFNKKQLFTVEELNKVMWKRIRFLGDVLKLGYSFIFTDLDVMWLRNPFPKLARNGEDMQINCDTYNGKPFDEANPIDTSFYFVVSNYKTTALFDEWYAYRNNSDGVKERDMLNMMKQNGAFRQLSMKVKFLDILYFSGFCQASQDLKEVITVHANCCSSEKAKLEDLTAMLEVTKTNDTKVSSWPEHNACHQSERIENKI